MHWAFGSLIFLPFGDIHLSRLFDRDGRSIPPHSLSFPNLRTLPPSLFVPGITNSFPFLYISCLALRSSISSPLPTQLSSFPLPLRSSSSGHLSTFESFPGSSYLYQIAILNQSKISDPVCYDITILSLYFYYCPPYSSTFGQPQLV